MLGKLIKLRLQGILSRTVSRRRPGSKGMLILFAALMIYCIGVFGFLFYGLFSLMADTLAAAPDYQWFYFALVGLLSFGLSFFFTAFTAKSELFEAKDNELLLSMPIKPRTILLSRMAVLLGTEYLVSLIVMIPAGIAWFTVAGMNVKQLVLYCIGSIFLPLFSASIACLIGWLLALLTARARNKTLVTMVFSLAFLAIYFIVYFNAQQYIIKLMEHYQTVAETGMMGWGFLFYWYGKGIASADLLFYLLVVLLALAAFAAAALLLGRGFLKVSSAGSRAKKRTGKLELQSSKLSSALLHKEFKRFTSSAVYMLNCGLGLVLCLIAAVALLVKADTVRGLLPMAEALGVPLSSMDYVLIVSVLLAFFCSMNIITAPSISLEGKEPVDPAHGTGSGEDDPCRQAEAAYDFVRAADTASVGCGRRRPAPRCTGLGCSAPAAADVCAADRHLRTDDESVLPEARLDE